MAIRCNALRCGASPVIPELEECCPVNRSREEMAGFSPASASGPLPSMPTTASMMAKAGGLIA